MKKESYLNKERVQTINTSSNVLYQMLGLKKIQIETAGGGDDAEVSLAGITVEEATELIALLNEPTPEVKAEETLDEVVEHTVEKKLLQRKTIDRIQVNLERDFISFCYIWSVWTIILINLFRVPPSR